MWKNNYQLYLSEKTKLEKQADHLSTMRLLCFLAGAALTILAFSYAGKAIGFAVLVISILSFIFFVRKHEKVIQQAEHCGKMAEVNQRCLQRIDGTWTDFPDDGQEYEDTNHSYTGDLDIFGHASLFQWMNTANTYHGREFIKILFQNPDKHRAKINRRQEAVKELASKIDFCQALQCEGMGDKHFRSNPEDLFAYAENQSKILGRTWLKSIFYLLPAITILSFIIWYYERSFPLIISLAALIIQILINVWGSGKVNDMLSNVNTYKGRIEAYGGMLEILEKETFHNEYLLELQSSLSNSGKSASEQIEKLEKIANAVSLKSNTLFYFPINQVVLWGFHCAFALEKWQEQSGKFLREWVTTIGKFEALGSLSMVAQINPDWSYSEFNEKSLAIAAEDMGHPLINRQSRVDNNLLIEDQICVVTGSNMSGKTTLLRTVGINLVLAYAGASVCAKKLTCSIMDIYTSMRIADDLNSGISTFYAELLRIKMIIDHARAGNPMIFLIDEVFRGTNSQDRVTGAQNVLMNLNKNWIIGLISTHDFELCDFENDPSGRIINYHFTETYTQNEIHFDYKLRKGRCQTRNAKYLMKMVGIDIRD